MKLPRRRFLQLALAISEKVLGPEHPWTAPARSNLANRLAAQGDLAGSRLFNLRELSILEKTARNNRGLG